MCRVLAGICRAAIYAWRVRPDSARGAIANRHLLGDIRRLASRASRSLWLARECMPRLRAEGHGCSRGRIERLMRQHGIRALAGRRFRPCTTDSRHDLPIAPNLLAQAGLHARNGAERHLARGHHLHRDWRRMALPRRGPRPRDTQDRRLVHARSHANRTAARRAHDGYPAAATDAWPHLSLGPRQPIRSRGLSKAACRHEGDTVHEPAHCLARNVAGC